ncbi:hypothetical protein [Saccharopolyspora pogona]|uniref:hypothetical protein n=1 Tax=Saccharopolyspora pogona TaxID=333966 RepID=UPI0016874DC5|nr:hypothetical protein [Saccharopolyspora pogona]
MSGVFPRQVQGPDTFEVSVAVTGGQLVVPTSGGKIGPAGAAAANVLGVALNDAQPAGSAPTNPINTGWPAAQVSVARDCDIRVTYNAATNFGDKLITAANGQVTAISGTAAAADARQIVGICTEPLGVAAGAVGRARIF